MASVGPSCRALLRIGFCVAAIACLCLAQGGGDRMQWNLASNPQALCNDFTRAGFFIRRNTSSDRWVIFLESGSLCFSSETCNNRFFRREVRPDLKCELPAFMARGHWFGGKFMGGFWVVFRWFIISGVMSCMLLLCKHGLS